ncbi:unnamed protein product [Paramecium octaurelia]|uniref:Nudix hydrolase domain-containing protein n=1 Tax=Paramecium octaurelia TaxID=43137 RepID=A0A8S1WJU6_PAROT|nr:unnamed protein product [Paramecium octaurelia]
MNKNAKFIWYVYNGNQRAKNKHQVFFKEQSNLKQAAVAIIFWTPNTISSKLPTLGQAHMKSICSQSHLLELLRQESFECKLMVCQRQFNLRDIHSNEICFPGGKLDNEESDFEAVIREVMEEVDVDLRKHQTFYLGRLPNNIEIKDAPKGLKVCSHVFMVSGEQPQVTLNVQELQDCKWIPISYFYDLSDKIRLGKCTQSFTFFMVKSFFQKFPKMIDEIVKNFDHGLFGQIDLGMKNHLFGFSLMIFTQMCNLVLSEQKEGKEYFGDIRLMNSIVHLMDLNFAENTFIGKLCDWYFSKMYKTFRIGNRVEVRRHLGKL